MLFRSIILLNATVNAAYIETAYNEALNAYNQQNYMDAATNFQKVVDLDENYQDGNAIYYLAQSYRNIGENEKAAEYYRKMIALYPGTERAANSQQYLESMDMPVSGDDAVQTSGDATPEGDNAPESDATPEGDAGTPEGDAGAPQDGGEPQE